MSEDFAHSKADQRAIDKINRLLYKLEQQAVRLRRQRDAIGLKHSPIQPGDIISWESGGHLKRGKVLSICLQWKGYEYRCHVLNMKGTPIGYASVDTSQAPCKLPKVKSFVGLKDGPRIASEGKGLPPCHKPGK